MRHAISIDVEDYFQVSNFREVVPFESWDTWPSRVERNTSLLLEELDRAGAKATFFVLGWCAERFPALVRRIVEAGHEVAAHSYDHRLVYDLEPAEFRSDLRKTAALLEKAGGVRVTGYRAPSFSITAACPWAHGVLVEEGYLFDSSVFPVRHHRYGNRGCPRFPHVIETGKGPLAEFPLSTLRVLGQNLPVAGGGYFRLLPVGLLARALRSIEREKKPFILYLHPWEFDPEQPRVEGVSRLRTLRHRLNLRRSLTKLRCLLGEFSFAPVSTVLADAGVLPTTPSR